MWDKGTKEVACRSQDHGVHGHAKEAHEKSQNSSCTRSIDDGGDDNWNMNQGWLDTGRYELQN